MYFVSVDEEDAYSRDSVNQLAQEAGPRSTHKLKIFEDAGHGTKVFDSHPEFIDELVMWFQEV